jgi:hypothetical protein
MTPAPAFNEAVCGRNPTQGGAIGQIAARIDRAAPALANVQCFSTRVLARRVTPAWPNAAHEQHARAVVVFQIIDIGSETRCVSNAYTSTRPCLGRNDNPG